MALGAAIAVSVTNPILALPLAFLSHFTLEPLPHWNPHTYTEIKNLGKLSTGTIAIIAIDSLTALFLGSLLAARQLPNIPKALVVLTACLLAVSPDLIEAPYYFLKWKNSFLEKTINFQRLIQFDVSPFPGLMTQAVVVLVFAHLAMH